MLTDDERIVLRALAEVADLWAFEDGPSYVHFWQLEEMTGLSKAAVRRACRGLRAKGLAAYAKALFCSWDGTLAGSGYAITKAWYELLVRTTGGGDDAR